MRTSQHERSTRRRRPGGFTLMELLVVIVIITLLSVVALPTIITSLNEREILDASAILQASLTVARDTAARTGNPTGVRLLLDPDISLDSSSGSYRSTIAANRLITITQAPAYNSGSIVVKQLKWVRDPMGPNPMVYQFLVAYEDKMRYVPDPINPDPTNINQYVLNPNYQPTSWAWNIRQGEKLRINGSSRYYTIAGPVTSASPTLNPERYINYDNPNSSSRVVSLPPGSIYPTGIVAPSLTPPGLPYAQPIVPINRRNPNFIPIANINTTGAEFVFLFNGLDDDGDGFVDEGFDGIDNDSDTITDPAFAGNVGDLNNLQSNYNPQVPSSGEYEPESLDLTTQQRYLNVPGGLPYTIDRRAVVAEGAREVALPNNVVVDLTMLNQTTQSRRPERSRLPMSQVNGTVDVLFAPNGQVLEDQTGVNVLPLNKNLPFYHFWLASKTDVFPPDAVRAAPFLPTPFAATNQGGPLRGERRLVTLYPKTGNTVINSLESFLNAAGNPDIEAPYKDAQSGLREP